jgi:hypothetical protein
MRDQLRAGPLPQSEQFAYLLAATLFTWANAQSPFFGPMGWNVLIGATHMLIVAFAIYYVYLCNGGRTGERFLERYLGLSWILMVRYFVLVYLPLLTFTHFYFDDFKADTPAGIITYFGATVAIQLLFYWFLGNQMRAVARPAT